MMGHDYRCKVTSKPDLVSYFNSCSKRNIIVSMNNRITKMIGLVLKLSPIDVTLQGKRNFIG